MKSWKKGEGSNVLGDFLVGVLLGVLLWSIFWIMPGSIKRNGADANSLISASVLKPSRVMVIYKHDLKEGRPTGSIEGDNLWFFLRFGVYLNDPRVSYTFVFTAPERQRPDSYVSPLPPKFLAASNIQQVFIRRSSEDERNSEGICGFSKFLKDNDIGKDSGIGYFFFVNSNFRGPFLPNYWRKPWWNMFTDIEETNRRISAVGSNLNCNQGDLMQNGVTMVNRKGLSFIESAQDACKGSSSQKVEQGICNKIAKSEYETRTFQHKNSLATDPEDGYREVHESSWVKYIGVDNTNTQHYVDFYTKQAIKYQCSKVSDKPECLNLNYVL